MSQTWSFRISPDIISPKLLEKTVFAGWGRIPKKSQLLLRDNELRITTESQGSGTFHVPVPVAGFGIVIISTQTLISRGKPYLLLKELCRGAVGQIHQCIFEWQMFGFRSPVTLQDIFAELSKRFSSAVVADFDRLGIETELLALLQGLIHFNLAATKAFTDQSLKWQMRNNEKIPLLFGAGTTDLPMETLETVKPYSEMLNKNFHMVVPMPSWKELEPEQGRFQWERLEQRFINAERLGKKIFLGPLLSFSPHELPVWLLPHLQKEGFLDIQATRYVNAITERYGYLADGWILANRFQTQLLPTVPHTRMLGIVRILAQQMRSRGIENPILVCIEQPWGEAALYHKTDWELVQIAEALIGCRDIDAFLLEIRIGSDCSGRYCTLPYDPMTISRKVDQWSFLEKSIYIMFSVPNGGAMIAQAAGLPQWTEELQHFWMDAILDTLVGKRRIKGIIWAPLLDHPNEQRGLLDIHFGQKPALQTMSAFREMCVK